MVVHLKKNRMTDIHHLKSANFMVSLCSVPVEGWGTDLNRDRSEGSLGIVPKIAIVSLVKWMKRNGYKRENWDFYDIDMIFPLEKDLRGYFKALQPHVVGLSAVVSTAYSQVKYISQIIREECPDCWIVMGGYLAASSEAVLFNTQVDVTIVGDGEIAWVQFLDYARKHGKVFHYDELKRIPGLCLIDDARKLHFGSFGPAVAEKDLALPDYEILEVGVKSNPSVMKNYFRVGLNTGWFDLDARAYESDRPPNIAGLFSSKGCVARCTFCQRATKGYRVQPYEDLDAHLKFLRKNYDVGFIQILDENFGSNKKHAYEFAKVLWENDMLWMAAGVRCTSVSEDDIVFYKEHGCSAFKFGVESGSQKILDLMEKGFTVVDVCKAVDLCIKHGIYSPLSVMVGMPGEDMESAAQTGDMIGRIAATIGVPPKAMGYDIFYALPLPGTPLYEYGELVGVIDKSPQGAGEYLERTVNAGIYKRNYVNLNGAPVSEVIFWDIFVAFEASRAYRKYSRSTSAMNLAVQRKYIEMCEKKIKNSKRFNLKYTALDFTFITWFIDNYLVGNIVVDYLPRFLVYPLIFLLNWLEFVIQMRFKKNLANNLFAMSGKGVSRIDFSKISNQKSNRARSLRGIVSGYDEVAQKVTMMSFDARSRRLLSKGL